MSNTKAGPDDADMLLRLMELQLTQAFQEAHRWWLLNLPADPPMNFEDFERRFPPDSEGDQHFTIVAKYWEGAGAIVRRGLIDEDLFFDRFRGVSSEWGRASEVLLGARRKYDPGIAVNFEWVARREAAWRRRRGYGGRRV